MGNEFLRRHYCRHRPMPLKVINWGENCRPRKRNFSAVLDDACHKNFPRKLTFFFTSVSHLGKRSALFLSKYVIYVMDAVDFLSKYVNYVMRDRRTSFSIKIPDSRDDRIAFTAGVEAAQNFYQIWQLCQCTFDVYAQQLRDFHDIKLTSTHKYVILWPFHTIWQFI